MRKCRRGKRTVKGGVKVRTPGIVIKPKFDIINPQYDGDFTPNLDVNTQIKGLLRRNRVKFQIEK